MGNTKCGKGCKVVDVVDPHGTPLAVHLAAAHESEVNLIEPTLDNLRRRSGSGALALRRRGRQRPAGANVCGRKPGIELVCPHRKSRKRPPTQDGRGPCRRYKRRDKVARTQRWFHNFRRTIIHYETTLERYTGWIHLACLIMTLRQF